MWYSLAEKRLWRKLEKLKEINLKILAQKRIMKNIRVVNINELFDRQIQRQVQIKSRI